MYSSAPAPIPRTRFLASASVESSSTGPLYVRSGERRVVHHVEELETELQVCLLRDLEALQQRGIPLVDAIRADVRERRRERPNMVCEGIGRIRVEQRRIKGGDRSAVGQRVRLPVVRR